MYRLDSQQLPTAGWRGWIGPLLVTALAAILRLPNLGVPHALIFDETYYVKDGLSLLNFGYEQTAVPNANEMLLASGGHDYLKIFTGDPAYIVHPPLGKWILGYSQYYFGATPFGWRLPMAILGILSVLLVARITRRLTRSNIIGTVAGLLLALDGLHIAMSRTALLDTPLSFFVLCAFGALVLDRDYCRERLRNNLSMNVRWWRWGMAICLGLAVATKWSGLYFAAAFGLLMLWWDFQNRRNYRQGQSTQKSQPALQWLKRDVLPALSMPFIIVAIYVASWRGWLTTSGGYHRQWAEASPDGIVPKALRSLFHYHAEMLSFHTHLTTPHAYKANPWFWPLMYRPTSFYYDSSTPCGAPSCAQEVIPLGNPLIWWGGIIALILMLVLAVRRLNSAAAPIMVAFAAGWVPWLFFVKRTTFNFYSVAFVPYTVMALAIALYYLNSVILARTTASLATEQVGQTGQVGNRAQQLAKRIVTQYWPLILCLLAITILTWYFYPVLVGQSIPYDHWHAKMWLRSWI